MSFNAKSNNSTKTAASPNDRRNYTKLYGHDGPFWTSKPTLSDNVFNYSKLVIIGTFKSDSSYKYYNISFDIIPGVTNYQGSCLMLSGNEMWHALMSVVVSSSSNQITITGQARRSESVNNSIEYSAIYGIR